MNRFGSSLSCDIRGALWRGTICPDGCAAKGDEAAYVALKLDCINRMLECSLMNGCTSAIQCGDDAIDMMRPLLSGQPMPLTRSA
ncbi:hypothetical protein [Magnetospirillum sp. UT-4]|uniref:hypothetical protein n=1 Tax=Magnetospirillum sp. UT-4 TaxID=2681467 RepID=UPI001383B73C|nr:hypothetical protein [Magnetospirillum sp. UT-4]CAA7619720.1 hypothetical protein MTBUT4_310058 [Magnetospirillum sp. UT-4]